MEKDKKIVYYCKVDNANCKEWLVGHRCKAGIEGRKPIECYHLVDGKIFKRSSNNE